MLDPQDRQLLHDVVRPPRGYDLDYAVGTTLSLDLTTLLAVPLAFTRYQYGEDSVEDLDPLVVLNALQDYAGKMTLFCQAGEIKVPPVNQSIYQLLEDVVVQANAPREGGAFHPKTWTFRYTPDDEDAPERYRFVCLSRNLTNARSWDTVVSLDGELTDRQNAYAVNHPVGEFVEALPACAHDELDDSVRDRIDQMAHEVRRVDFDVPEPFELLRFHHFGLENSSTWPFPDSTWPLIVISPFLTERLLDRFEPADRDATLISRWDELQGVSPETLSPWDVYTLDQGAELDVQDLEPEEEPSEDDTGGAAHIEGEEAGMDTLRGLHAKVFHIDAGWDTHLFTGSANATAPAFHRNVEFLVELRGKKSRCGTETVLAESDDGSDLRDLLYPYSPEEDYEPDQISEQLDDVMLQLKSTLVEADLQARVDRTEDGYTITVTSRSGPISFPEDTVVSARPITLREKSARTIEEGTVEFPSYPPLSMEMLTGFFAFEAEVTIDGTTRTRSFVLNVPLEGAPADREQHLLRSIISDPSRFIQFLALLLGDVDDELGFGLSQGRWWNTGDGRRGGRTDDLPVLESLLKVLYRNPDQLDRVHELLVDLRETGDTSDIVPEEFERVFEPIWRVKEELRQ